MSRSPENRGSVLYQFSKGKFGRGPDGSTRRTREALQRAERQINGSTAMRAALHAKLYPPAESSPTTESSFNPNVRIQIGPTGVEIIQTRDDSPKPNLTIYLVTPEDNQNNGDALIDPITEPRILISPSKNNGYITTFCLQGQGELTAHFENTVPDEIKKDPIPFLENVIQALTDANGHATVGNALWDQDPEVRRRMAQAYLGVYTEAIQNWIGHYTSKQNVTP